MITLAISHNLFLSHAERYRLVSGKQIETWGISVPTWFWEKGQNTEKSSEIFCKYILTNTPEDYPATMLSDGYKINLPQITEGHQVHRLSPEELKTMTRSEQDEYYQAHPIPVTALDLLDEEDGGIASLCFKRYNKVRDRDKKMNVIHTVELQTIELLEGSLS